MKTKVNYIPEGFHAVTPYLTVRNPDEAINFYKQAFAAKERTRMTTPEGKVAHAELQIGDSIFMLGSECPDHGNLAPESMEGASVTLTLYVKNVDQVFNDAVDAGATVKEAVDDKFWGDRTGTLIDPSGHRWMILTHIEDVSPAEMKKRAAEAFAPEPAGKK